MDALSKAEAGLKTAEVVAVRDAAVEYFPITDAEERAPELARAYVFASFDVFRIRLAPHRILHVEHNVPERGLRTFGRPPHRRATSSARGRR
jgi:hypothetical protein